MIYAMIAFTVFAKGAMTMKSTGTSTRTRYKAQVVALGATVWDPRNLVQLDAVDGDAEAEHESIDSANEKRLFQDTCTAAVRGPLRCRDRDGTKGPTDFAKTKASVRKMMKSTAVNNVKHTQGGFIIHFPTNKKPVFYTLNTSMLRYKVMSSAFKKFGACEKIHVNGRNYLKRLREGEISKQYILHLQPGDCAIDFPCPGLPILSQRPKDTTKMIQECPIFDPESGELVFDNTKFNHEPVAIACKAIKDRLKKELDKAFKKLKSPGIEGHVAFEQWRKAGFPEVRKMTCLRGHGIGLRKTASVHNCNICGNVCQPVASNRIHQCGTCQYFLCSDCFRTGPDLSDAVIRADLHLGDEEDAKEAELPPNSEY